MERPPPDPDQKRPTFTREQLERELAIVEERERRKAQLDTPPAPRLGNE